MTRQKYVFVLVLALYLFTSVGLQLEPIRAASLKANLSSGAAMNEGEEEILWLARLVYSETKRPEEQVLVAWVVRNRVESNYTGQSYKEVALHDSQFSGLNSFDRQYRRNVTMGYDDKEETWQSALSVAKAVYYADEVLNPFPKTVRHFYSPVSVSRKPAWARSAEPITVIKDGENNSVRFAFYDGVR